MTSTRKTTNTTSPKPRASRARKPPAWDCARDGHEWALVATDAPRLEAACLHCDAVSEVPW